MYYIIYIMRNLTTRPGNLCRRCQSLSAFPKPCHNALPRHFALGTWEIMSFRRALPGVKARLSAAIGPLNQSVTGPLSQLTEFDDADNLPIGIPWHNRTRICRY